jgi:hypothetical protein
MTARVPLPTGETCLVDEQDAALLSGRSLWLDGRGYVRISGGPGKRPVHLHLFLARPPRGFVVDHRSGDRLDNRRGNFRVCRQKDNARNRRLHSNSSTGFKGVVARGKAFASHIVVDGRQFHLGVFASPVLAARAYDRAATLHFGEFARLNFSAGRDWLIPGEGAA